MGCQTPSECLWTVRIPGDLSLHSPFISPGSTVHLGCWCQCSVFQISQDSSTGRQPGRPSRCHLPSDLCLLRLDSGDGLLALSILIPFSRSTRIQSCFWPPLFLTCLVSYFDQNQSPPSVNSLRFPLPVQYSVPTILYITFCTILLICFHFHPRWVLFLSYNLRRILGFSVFGIAF